jgi:hypothetical protein
MHRMAGYSRPWSKGELRYMRRQKMRTITWCGVVVCFALAAMVGVLYLLSSQKP